MNQTHQAALQHEGGGTIQVTARPTPEPGLNEVLIQTRAVTINPSDVSRRDKNYPPAASFPVVFGGDLAGVVVKVGPHNESGIAVGCRVLALATDVFHNGSQYYGSFQEFVLVPVEALTLLPNSVSFEDGVVMPVATMTAWGAWNSIGLPVGQKDHFKSEDKEAVLIWGGAGSVGTVSIQTARFLGFRVYGTASSKHHDYLRELGADRTFDYNAPDVISQIISAAAKEGLKLRTAHCAVPGCLEPVVAVLDRTRGTSPATVTDSAVFDRSHPIPPGIEVVMSTPLFDDESRRPFFSKIFGGWLQSGLRDGVVVPSPKAKMIDGGLAEMNDAVDEIARGVSCQKLVVTCRCSRM
ncbi:GroES-like protein [Sarocladium strictum]